jgi:hypothetical protein
MHGSDNGLEWNYKLWLRLCAFQTTILDTCGRLLVTGDINMGVGGLLRLIEVFRE